MAPARPRSIAVIANGAFSIINFRGPLIRQMVAQGVQVYALAPDFDASLREAARALGAEPIDIALDRTGIRPIRDIIDGVALYRRLRGLRPDATFGYFIKPVIYGSLAAWMAGVPRRYALVAGLGYVFTDDDRAPGIGRRVLRWMVMQLYRMGFAACHVVFFQNQDDIDHFVGGGVLCREKARRLNGTGVDMTRYPASAPVLDPVKFVLAARLLREKGIREFIGAARIVRRRAPDARFTILGGLDSNPGGIDAAEVAAWRSEGVVDMPGHVDDVAARIADSSVYVLPSYREGMPRSTQEAMAIGRAIITTDVVGCRDTVIDGDNGFLVPPRNADALAAAMLRFIEQPDLIARMGARSREMAEQRFDVVAINEVMLTTMGVIAATDVSG